jgi:hypothetical protein
LIGPLPRDQAPEAEANYGLDLLEAIGSITTPSALAALPGQIQSELRKDERISEVIANVVETSVGPAKSKAWSITINAETAEGPFTLVIGVSDVTVELLGLQVGS